MRESHFVRMGSAGTQKPDDGVAVTFVLISTIASVERYHTKRHTPSDFMLLLSR